MDKNALMTIITILVVAEISNPNNQKGRESLSAIDMWGYTVPGKCTGEKFS